MKLDAFKTAARGLQISFVWSYSRFSFSWNVRINHEGGLEWAMSFQIS